MFGGWCFGVVVGIGCLFGLLWDFCFGDDELCFFWDEKVVDVDFFIYLENYWFMGLICGYCEGEFYFFGLLILMVEGMFVDVVVLEMFVLSVFNYDFVVVIVVFCMSIVVGECLLVEMGF